MTDAHGLEQPMLPGMLIDEMLRQFADRIDALEQRDAEFTAALDGIQQELHALAGQQSDLDDRLRTLQRLFTEQRNDVTAERSLVLHGLADEYRVLVGQRFLHVARQLVDVDQPDSGLQMAQTVGELCRALFSHDKPRAADVLDALGLDPAHPGAPSVLQARGLAIGLRDRAGAAPDRVGWDFDAEPGTRVSDRQAPWASCPPNLPVRFVVAPALLGNDTLLVPQLVYTSARPPDPPAVARAKRGFLRSRGPRGQ